MPRPVRFWNDKFAGVQVKGTLGTSDQEYYTPLINDDLTYLGDTLEPFDSPDDLPDPTENVGKTYFVVYEDEDEERSYILPYFSDGEGWYTVGGDGDGGGSVSWWALQTPNVEAEVANVIRVSIDILDQDDGAVDDYTEVLCIVREADGSINTTGTCVPAGVNGANVIVAGGSNNGVYYLNRNNGNTYELDFTGPGSEETFTVEFYLTKATTANPSPVIGPNDGSGSKVEAVLAYDAVA